MVGSPADNGQDERTACAGPSQLSSPATGSGPSSRPRASAIRSDSASSSAASALALPPHIAAVRAGRLAATRVPSRNEPAASASASEPAGPAAAQVVSAAATMCGAWLIRATALSWSTEVAGTTRAPNRTIQPAVVSQSSSLVPSSSVSTQAEPSTSFGSAVRNPDVSRPAIGCPPTQRAAGCRAATSRRTGSFTEVTSVTRPRYGVAARSPRTAPKAGSGTAMTTRSADATATARSSATAAGAATSPRAASRMTGSAS